MRKILLTTLCLALLTGCSSGVPQEQYESVVAERDAYKSQLEEIEDFEHTNSSESSTEEKQSKKKEEPHKIELIDSGWCSYKRNDYAHVTYAVKIKNPNIDLAVEFPKVIITARDSGGNILANDERTLNSIAGDDTIVYGDEIFYEGDEPETVEISVTNGKNNYENQDDDTFVKQEVFSISNTSENIGSYDRKYTGEITNNSSVDFGTVAVIVIYKQADKMVGGDIEYVDDLEAGSTKVFELSADSDMTQYDSYEFYAIQW